MASPKRVTLTLPIIRSLTVLEAARACAIAGVRLRDSERVLRAVNNPNAEPEDDAQAAALLYAYALMIERRTAPGTTWEEAQGWALAFDVGASDPIADAEAEASVATSIATGLPPAVAGELTLAQAEAYGQAGRELARTNRSGRRG